MKRLQEETMTKMAVLGRGSMRSKQQVRIARHIRKKNIPYIYQPLMSCSSPANAIRCHQVLSGVTWRH